jgi:nitroreductase
MEFDEVVRRRRMVRTYDPERPVPIALRDKLLAHARRAPSAGFSQGWGFLVLESPSDRALFWSSTTDPDEPSDAWLARLSQAPLIVVPFSSEAAYRERYAAPDKAVHELSTGAWPVPFWHIDAGFASMLMLLTAVDVGLGACFFGVPVPFIDNVRAAFGVPHSFAPVGAITFGYELPGPTSPSLKRGHKPAAEVIHLSRWQPHPAPAAETVRFT